MQRGVLMASGEKVVAHCRKLVR